MADTSNKEEKVKFFDGVKGEFHKITWPDREAITKQTIAVAAVTVVTGAIIAILDFFVQYGVNFLTQ
ncbi:MAG: preprotein translocase subunit SecE [Lachnospiraceae bacterium]|nr:preprotein translocase subunit SecE [Lachnospiraceae bacterium]